MWLVIFIEDKLETRQAPSFFFVFLITTCALPHPCIHYFLPSLRTRVADRFTGCAGSRVATLCLLLPVLSVASLFLALFLPNTQFPIFLSLSLQGHLLSIRVLEFRHFLASSHRNVQNYDCRKTTDHDHDRDALCGENLLAVNSRRRPSVTTEMTERVLTRARSTTY